MTYVIGEPCVDAPDRACVDGCPVDCIYEGERMLYIYPDEGVDCRADTPFVAALPSHASGSEEAVRSPAIFEAAGTSRIGRRP